MKGKVIRRAPYVIAVNTEVYGVQFVREVDDNGTIRKEFCQRPHEATRYKIKKDATKVADTIPAVNHPYVFTMDYVMGFVAVVAISPKDSNVPH